MSRRWLLLMIALGGALHAPGLPSHDNLACYGGDVWTAPRMSIGLVGRANGWLATQVSAPSTAKPEQIVCNGKYGGHLQGLATDGKSIFWSFTVRLVKTDLTGRIVHSIEVRDHHGDLTYHQGKLYIAVEFGEFNQPAGQSDPWVFVYDAKDLSSINKIQVPELVHGSGGIAFGDGRFVVVGGLPGDHQQNYAFEYDQQLQFVKRHELPSGQTRLGIQTAGYFGDHWWFGCYGSPQNPGLLKVNRRFELVDSSKTNFSYGVVQLRDDVILRGECFDDQRRGKAELVPLASNSIFQRQ